MNPYRNTRTSWTFKIAFIAALLATVSLSIGIAPSTSAQVAPASLLATQFFDAIGGGTPAYLLNAGAVFHTPEGDFTGGAGLTEFGDGLEASFSDLAFTTESVEQAGGLTIIRFTLSGTNTGGYHGTAANCAGISVPAVAVLRVNEETVQTDPWISGAMSQHMGLPEVIEQRLVVEQWIGYNSAVIVSQIVDSDLRDLNNRPGCTGQDEADAVPASVPPPCMSAETCELPTW